MSDKNLYSFLNGPAFKLIFDTGVRREILKLIQSGGSGGGVTATFNASIPLTRDYTYMYKVVSAPLTISPNMTGAILGGSAEIEFVADGTNEPDLSAFTLSNGSYDNTQGQVNVVIIQNLTSGVIASIIQGPLVTYPDTTAPTVSSRAVADTTHVNNVMSEAVSGTIAGFSFRINGGSWFAPVGVTGTTTRVFDLGTTIAPGDTVDEKYDAVTGDTVDTSTNANPLATFSAASVTNGLVTSGDFTDDFNRADSSVTPGGAWTVNSGDWGIASNNAYCVSENNSGGFRVENMTQDAGAPISTIDFTIKLLSSTSFGGAVCRYVDENNHLMLEIQPVGYVLYKKQAGGSYAQLGALGLITIPTNTDMAITIEDSGSSIVVKQGGVTQFTTATTLFNTATKAGPQVESGISAVGGGIRFNSFSATV